MADLSSEYLGLPLKNPLVPSASPLSRSLDSARALEDAGAAALVMYSLFEEELVHEEENMARFLIEQEIGHAEASSFLPFHHQYERGLDQYLNQLQALKQDLSIPVIASLNGITPGGWLESAQQLEAAGADALELNMYYIAGLPEMDSGQVERRYIEVLRHLRQHISIPITLKLSPQFSSLPHFISQIESAGANGAALFNRFYQPDIDLETLGLTPHVQLSRSEDALLAMRWIAILFGRTGLSLAATGGVHTAADAVKLLLSGANAVHVCSVLLKQGPRCLGDILKGLSEWLEQSEYESVNDMRGRLSQQHCSDPAAYERASYLWTLDSYTPGPGVLR